MLQFSLLLILFSMCLIWLLLVNIEYIQKSTSQEINVISGRFSHSFSFIFEHFFMIKVSHVYRLPAPCPACIYYTTYIISYISAQWNIRNCLYVELYVIYDVFTDMSVSATVLFKPNKRIHTLAAYSKISKSQVHLKHKFICYLLPQFIQRLYVSRSLFPFNSLSFISSSFFLYLKHICNPSSNGAI